MTNFNNLEDVLLRLPVGLMSRFRVLFYRSFGMHLGERNRFEKGRIRRISQIKIGHFNAFSQGWCLWPEDGISNGHKIIIGSNNYFNRNIFIDACNHVQIGDYNMFGPDVCINDSNHQFALWIYPSKLPMNKGNVKIGNGCWIGAKAVILKDVHIGDFCVIGAGAVVTKSFPIGSVIGGVPAKLIKTIS